MEQGSIFKMASLAIDPWQTASSLPLPLTSDSTLGPRQSKRKRKEVIYYESENEDDVLTYDPDDDTRPSKKPKVATKEKKLPKKKIFPFMSLPAEIRNAIYEMALRDPSGHHLNSQTKAHRRSVKRMSIKAFKETNTSRRNRGNGRRFWRTQSNLGQSADATTATTSKNPTSPVVALAPTILAVSKKIYNEAILYLYSTPVICLDTYTLHSFLTIIGPRHRGMLRDIEVTEWGYSATQKSINFPAVSMLADAVKLERFSIWIDSWGGAEKMAKRVFRDCYIFLEAFGIAKSNKFAAIDVLELAEECFISRRWNYVTRQMEEDQGRDKMEAAFKKRLRHLMC